MSAMRPKTPAARYATASATSLSHSWFTHGMSCVNEYRIDRGKAPVAERVQTEPDVAPQVGIDRRVRADDRRRHQSEQTGGNGELHGTHKDSRNARTVSRSA